MKKKLNVQSVTNELRGKSAFFPNGGQKREPSEVQPQSPTTQDELQQESLQSKSSKKKYSREKKESLQTSKLTNLQTYTSSHVNVGPAMVASFRMSEKLLDKIDDIQHFLKKEYRIKLKKKELVAMALSFAFWDLEKRGKESGLVKVGEAKENLQTYKLTNK